MKLSAIDLFISNKCIHYNVCICAIAVSKKSMCKKKKQEQPNLIGLSEKINLKICWILIERNFCAFFKNLFNLNQYEIGSMLMALMIKYLKCIYLCDKHISIQINPTKSMTK